MAAFFIYSILNFRC